MMFKSVTDLFIVYNFFQMIKTRRTNKIQEDFLKQAGIWQEIQPTCNTFNKIKKISKLPKPKQKLLFPSKKLLNSQKNIADLLIPQFFDQQSSITSNFIETKSEEFSIHEQKSIQQFSVVDYIKIPSYISTPKQNIISGYLGHSSIVFKNLIIQGSFYLELKILDSDQQRITTQNKSAVRIGLCQSNHLLDTSIGKGNSIAYSSSKGSLIYNSIPRQFGQPAKIGDTLGMAVKIPPPHKKRIQKQISKQSELIFYKNGIQMGKIQNELLSNFYNFGISLYNYAKVQIRVNQSQMQYKPQNYEPACNLFTLKFPYQNLQL